MICNNCKKEIPDDTILCPNCSYNVTIDKYDDSVLGEMKKMMDKRREKNEKHIRTRNPYKKYLLIVLIIVLLIQAVLIRYLASNKVRYIDYDGYLVEYVKENNQYTGIYEYERIYEYESNNEKIRVTYDQYFNTKEEVPKEILIHVPDERWWFDEHYDVFFLLIFGPYIILAVISTALDIKYKKKLRENNYEVS